MPTEDGEIDLLEYLLLRFPQKGAAPAAESTVICCSIPRLSSKAYHIPVRPVGRFEGEIAVVRDGLFAASILIELPRIHLLDGRGRFTLPFPLEDRKNL